MSEFKLIPTLDRVFIVCDEIETKTKSGVVIPVSGQEETTRGMIVAAGPDCRNPNLAGKKVLFLKAHGVVMNEGGVEIRIMREGDTLGYEDEHASQQKNWGEINRLVMEDPSQYAWELLQEKYVIIKKDQTS